MKPLIGILSNIATIKSGAFIGLEKAFVCNEYINAVEKSGGVPIMIPTNTNKENIRRQIEAVDGIIISGGGDINPVLFHEEPIEKSGNIHPDRDIFDLEAIKVAIELNKPILGICRGLQAINVALGGNIYQDLSMIKNHFIKHNQDTKAYLGTHYVDIKENTRLYNILGNKALVNSYHHQSVKNLGKDLEAVAYSSDKVVEAIERKGDLFVVGVQWHPEMMVEKNENMLKLFEVFIEESKKTYNK